jgi:tetratricopeptide (TPR) repeat protein
MSVRTVLLASVCLAFLGGAAEAADKSGATLLAEEAYAALTAGNTSRAIQAYSQAIESRELSVEVLANSLVNRGLAYQRAGEHKHAVDDYTAALRIDAMNAQLRAMALYNRGLANEKLGRPALAIEDYTSALFLEPRLPQAYFSRGSALRESGQLLFALADFEKALKLGYPHRYLVHFNMGAIYQTLGRPEEARRSFMQSVAENPNFAPARKRLAAVGGIVMPQPKTAEVRPPETDQITTATLGTARSKPLFEPAAKPVQMASAETELAAQNAAVIPPKPRKHFTDRIPPEEADDLADSTPARTETAPRPAAEKKPEEKILAVEFLPEEEPAATEPAIEPASAPPEPLEASEEAQEEPKFTGWAVQLSSQKDEKVAWKLWEKLKAKHRLLESHKPVVMKADLGDRGIVYRLRLSGFEDQESAKGVCAKLKSRGLSCYVSKLDS